MRLSELLVVCRREMAGVRDAAPGEAEILVSAVTGIPRNRLFLSMDDDVGDASVQLFPRIARRAAGEPLQYVLGAWDFFGREFLLSPDTLIPRPETELLVDEALRLAPNAPRTIADVGTGCGAIAVALATRLPQAVVYAIDDSQPALSLAARNVARGAASALWVSVGVAALSGFAGIVASWYLDTATGATVVLATAACFAVTALYRVTRPRE